VKICDKCSAPMPDDDARVETYLLSFTRQFNPEMQLSEHDHRWFIAVDLCDVCRRRIWDEIECVLQRTTGKGWVP
jgi:hypothetical protein